MKCHFLTTLWRATLKIITLITLGFLYVLALGTVNETFMGALLLGAAILWVIEGLDRGIEALPSRRS